MYIVDLFVIVLIYSTTSCVYSLIWIYIGDCNLYFFANSLPPQKHISCLKLDFPSDRREVPIEFICPAKNPSASELRKFS